MMTYNSVLSLTVHKTKLKAKKSKSLTEITTLQKKTHYRKNTKIDQAVQNYYKKHELANEREIHLKLEEFKNSRAFLEIKAEILALGGAS